MATSSLYTTTLLSREGMDEFFSCRKEEVLTIREGGFVRVVVQKGNKDITLTTRNEYMEQDDTRVL